jgi:hypothetical protein
MKRMSIAATLLLVLAGSASAAVIAPHRAIYDLSLDKTSAGSSLAAVDGRLAFEINDAGCDGWTVSFRMANRYSPTDADPRLVDTQSTAYENASATEMDYQEKSFVNQKLDSESRVKISRSGTSATGAGKIMLPEAKDFELAAGALLPMQHQIHLMDMAEKGDQRDVSLIYDGSDGANAFRAITFIGKEKLAGQNARDLANPAAIALAKLKSWPISISYYALDGGDTPSYQVSFDLYENGVATGLKMDYGTFALQGELKNLELLPAESCN